MPDAIWWRCGGSSEQLPELAPCDVLAASPEIAARERWTEVRITDRGAGRLDRIRQGALRGGRG